MGKFHRKGRKGKRGGENAQRKPREVQGQRCDYEEIPKINADFEKYYKLQKICPEEEWDTMMSTIRESLPTSFRITGSKSEALAMRHMIETKMIKDIAEVAKTEGGNLNVKAFPLPWYPDRMGWQLNLTRKDIRQNEAYYRFHNFLMAETESGNISRQEAVSMIPPLALNVLPHHKVLDMCASPGSKTAQIIEMLHAGDDSSPEGYVVANDVDNKRCYMLVHQGKRLQSPAFIVTNADASKYPDVLVTNDDGTQSPLKFDRILCDVPCSGDGTIRKNVDVWKKWNSANSLYLKQLQYQILKRGMELLSVGGLLVYSTCSLNPYEDESVVHRMLKEAQGAVQLLDINLPGLKATKGLKTWAVVDRDLIVYEKMEDVPEKWATTIRPTTFPPSEEEADSFNLDKCLRILPHHQDTGGFFIALFSKTKPLPWEEISVTTVKKEETSPEKKEAEKESFVPPPKKPKRSWGFKEDPYIFMDDDHQIWPDIKKFYQFDESMKSTNFLKRTDLGKIKNVYLTTENARNFVMSNEKSVKIINVGVKALSRIDSKWCNCPFRLSQEGLPSISPHIKGRRIRVTRDDLALMLHQSEADKAPLVESFSPDTRAAIADLEKGSLILLCDFPVEGNGPNCSLELVGWRGAASLRCYVQKHDRLHYLRICGEDLSKYDINKFKEKENGAAASTSAETMEVCEAGSTISLSNVNEVGEVSEKNEALASQSIP